MDPIEQIRALATILRKEIHRFMRIWMQTLIPPAIMIMLYFVIFGEIIGSRIGKMGEFDYMQFMVPGLIMMSVISNSYSNVVSSFFGQKFARSIEELLITPLPNYIILVGWVLGRSGARPNGWCYSYRSLIILFRSDMWLIGLWLYL